MRSTMVWIVPALLVLFATPPAAAPPLVDFSSSPDSLFASRCHTCHENDLGHRGSTASTARQSTSLLLAERGVPEDSATDLVRRHRARQSRLAERLLGRCDACHETTLLADAYVVDDDREAQAYLTQALPSLEPDDIQVIVRHHQEDQRAKLEAMLEFGGGDPEAIELLMSRCSTCHDLQRAIVAFSDERVWEQTLSAMSRKSGSNLSKEDVEGLIELHSVQKEKERALFAQRCTGCHTAERTRLSIRTSEEWRDVITVMVGKSGEAISEEELALLSNYHVSEFRLLEQQFREQCTTCHDAKQALFVGEDQSRLKGILAVMAERAGGTFAYEDLQKVVGFHHERERALSASVFDGECGLCHSFDRPEPDWRAMRTRFDLVAEAEIDPNELQIHIDYHRQKRRIGGGTPDPGHSRPRE